MTDQIKTSIWVPGASGQLGRCFQNVARDRRDLQFVFTTHDELDITQVEEVHDFLSSHNIDGCINCAAFTDVDGAESSPARARSVNAEAVSHLTDALPEDVWLIQYSTDYVFDCPLNRPLREDDPVSPASVYGRTKLAGEQVILNRKKQAIIIRTSWLYSPYGENFVKTMLRLSAERDRLKVVSDQIGSPTYAMDLAEGTLELLDKYSFSRENKATIFHYSNSGVASWYDFAQTIFDLADREVNIEPVGTEAFPRPASRPSYSVLDCSRICELIGHGIPWWRSSLKSCLELMRKTEPKLFPKGN